MTKGRARVWSCDCCVKTNESGVSEAGSYPFSPAPDKCFNCHRKTDHNSLKLFVFRWPKRIGVLGARFLGTLFRINSFRFEEINDTTNGGNASPITVRIK